MKNGRYPSVTLRAPPPLNRAGALANYTTGGFFNLAEKDLELRP